MIQNLTGALQRARDGSDVRELAGQLSDELMQIRDSTAAAEPLVVSAAQLDAPSVSYAIESLLPQGMLAVLSGRDKRGKTLLAQEMARAVLRGAALFGRFSSRSGPVVAAFLDDPLSITLERLDALEIREHGNLFLVHPLRFTGDALGFLGDLEREAARLDAVLVVVDALYLLAPSSRDAGNDAARMTPLMRRLDRLASVTGAATLVVAHDNKSGADVAGSYVVRAMAKTIFRLGLPRQEEDEAGEGPPKTKRRVLSIESKLVPAAALMLELRGVGDWASLGTPEEVRAKDLKGAIKEFLETTAAYIPEPEIHAGVRGRRAAKQAALRELVGLNEVLRLGAGKTREPYLYGSPKTLVPMALSKGRVQEKSGVSGGFDGAKSGTGGSGTRNAVGTSISASSHGEGCTCATCLPPGTEDLSFPGAGATP